MPSTLLRQQVLCAAKTVVIKMGTSVLTNSEGKLDLPFLCKMAKQIAELKSSGRHVTLVSSGAIGAGLGCLGLSRRPKDIAQLQAVAAVGQPRLVALLQEAFAPFDMQVAQLLLTRTDFDDRSRFLNIRNCVTQLQSMNCLPVVNENDTVAVDELRLGDNDQLAALMCNALRANALVMLSVIDGLLDGQGNRVDLVDDVDHITGLVRKDKSKLGTGGMTTKLEAARLVTGAGEVAVIANGREPDVLQRIFSGEKIGTVFVPRARRLDSRARWIGLTSRPSGTVQVDQGAADALVSRGKSLLASGIVCVSGGFERGAVVSLTGPGGSEIARGLTNYSAAELEQIKGKHSRDFEKLLGRSAYAEAIHCDNLVVTAREKTLREK